MNLHSEYIGRSFKTTAATLWVCASMVCSVSGQMVDTNLAMWLADPSLVWSSETNGFRVVIDVWPESSPTEVNVYVISSKTRRMVYVYPPSGKLPRMELRGTNGIIVLPIKDKMDGILPKRISAAVLPRTPQMVYHGVYNYVLMGQNGPTLLKGCLIGDVYRVKKEEDYTLTVYPVLYKFETNYEYADRVDLPTVTTTIHLKPPSE